MTSIRRFGVRSGSRRSASSSARSNAVSADTTKRLPSYENGDPFTFLLLHPPRVGEQVEVAEHLRQREVRLRHGDVSPQRLGDLVGRARSLGEQAVDLVGPPAVQLEALVDQRAVIDDRVTVTGQHQ